MATLHTDYLNIDWNPDVIQRWTNEGSLDEISRRLGYRFELQTAELTQTVRPSSLLQLNFDLHNVGFGELFNPRDVEVTLTNNATGVRKSAVLQVDPRYWAGGSSPRVATLLTVPADLPEGTYTLGLRLPDKEDSIRNDVRYAVRFANEEMWDAVDGINVLTTDLVVSYAAGGTVYANLDNFTEVTDPASLIETIDADFDRNGVVNTVDIDVLVAQIAAGTGSLLYDLTGDGQVDSHDLTRWLADAGAANLASGNPYPFGDANLDGVVDGQDFIAWNANKFTSSPAWSLGDFNADGVVDGLDFIVWNTNKFSSALTAVPEPMSGLGLIAFGGAILSGIAVVRRHRPIRNH
jgi:hypothetical protein